MFDTIRFRLLFCEDGSETPADETAEVIEFALPEDLSALDDEALAALEEQAVTAFDAARDGDLTAEGAMETLGGLAEAVAAVRGEQERRETAAAEAQAEADRLAEQVHGAAPTEEEETPEGETPAEGEEGAEGAAPEGEPEAETPAEPEAVAAATTPPAPRSPARTRPRSFRVPLGAIRQHAPEPPVPASTGGTVITAAGDLQDWSSGQRMGDTLDVARAMSNRARLLSDGQSALIASFATGGSIVIEERASASDQLEAVAAACDPVGRIVDESGGILLDPRSFDPGYDGLSAMTAAGGWCAPSDRRFDLFSIEAMSGMVDIPSLTIERGGLEYVIDGGPSIADVMAAPWLWTEALDIEAGNNPHEDPDDDVTKPCVRVPCPEWDEERLDAHGICVNHGNLADRAWPALTRRFIDLVLAAHAHVVNARIITSMIAVSDAVTIANTFGAWSATYAAAAEQAADYRDKFRMDDDAVLEAVFPSWALPMWQVDVARRAGIDPRSTPRSQFVADLISVGVRPQFVQDFDPLQLAADGQAVVGGAGDGFRETWPANTRFMLYAPGTHIRGTGGNIDLGVSRDSRQNEVNDHTAAWSEEFILHTKVGHESRIVTVTGTCPDGQAGGKPIVDGDYACPIA